MEEKEAGKVENEGNRREKGNLGTIKRRRRGGKKEAGGRSKGNGTRREGADRKGN